MGQCCFHGISNVINQLKTPEEQAIEIKEYESPFRSIKLEKLESSLQIHNYNHRLNKSDLRKVFHDLGLSLESLSDPECPQFKYFEALMDKDKLYTQRKIVMGSVLLSAESILQKVKIISKYYDFSNNEALESDEIESLLDEIVEISVNALPLMTVNTINFNNDESLISEKNYFKYADYLLISKTKFIQKYSKKILGNEKSINFSDFLTKICNTGLSILFTSQNIRLLLFKQTNKKHTYP